MIKTVKTRARRLPTTMTKRITSITYTPSLRNPKDTANENHLFQQQPQWMKWKTVITRCSTRVRSSSTHSIESASISIRNSFLGPSMRPRWARGSDWPLNSDPLLIGLVMLLATLLCAWKEQLSGALGSCGWATPALLNALDGCQSSPMTRVSALMFYQRSVATLPRLFTLKK